MIPPTVAIRMASDQMLALAARGHPLVPDYVRGLVRLELKRRLHERLPAERLNDALRARIRWLRDMGL